MALSTIWSWMLVLNYVVVPFVLGSLLLRRKEPASLAAWGLAIVFVPFMGMVFYWVLGSERIPRKARRRRKRIARLTSRLLHRIQADAAAAQEPVNLLEDGSLLDIERMGRRLAQMPATGGNQVELLNDTASFYDALTQMIRDARRHLHLEFYIWNDDQTGREFRDLLIEAAQRGVECRVLLDAAGAYKIGRRFLSPWRRAGVQVAFFLPRIFERWRFTVNFRNHRKLVVADGRTALLGSQNIGDEYRGRHPALPVWIDSNVKLSGPAVAFVQEVFAEDWFYSTRQDLSGPGYFQQATVAGTSVMQVLPTGPDQAPYALEHVLFCAVAEARRSIRIATPYFVPDRAMRMALRHAALRGVEVELIVSQRTDVMGIIWASRSFYAELLDVGVKIYEFPLGMLHSKVITIDDAWAMVGSANMDVRSFRLNFELTALVYDVEVARQGASWFAARRDESQPVRLEDVYRWPLVRRMAAGFWRLLSPVL